MMGSSVFHLLFATVLFTICNAVVQEYYTSGTNQWSAITASVGCIPWLFYRLFVSDTDFGWARLRELFVPVLYSSLIAYIEIVNLTGTFTTTNLSHDRTLWFVTISIPIAIAVAISFQLRKIEPYIVDCLIGTSDPNIEHFTFRVSPVDHIPFSVLVIGVVIYLIIAIIQLLESDETTGRWWLVLTNIVSILLWERLSKSDTSPSRLIDIPPLVLIMTICRMLYTTDWHMNEITSHFWLSVGTGIASYVAITSMFYLCLANTVFFPSSLACGARTILYRHDISHSMVGMALLTTSFFFWFFGSCDNPQAEPLDLDILPPTLGIEIEQHRETNYGTI